MLRTSLGKRHEHTNYFNTLNAVGLFGIELAKITIKCDKSYNTIQQNYKKLCNATFRCEGKFK